MFALIISRKFGLCDYCRWQY